MLKKDLEMKIQELEGALRSRGSEMFEKEKQANDLSSSINRLDFELNKEKQQSMYEMGRAHAFELALWMVTGRESGLDPQEKISEQKFSKLTY